MPHDKNLEKLKETAEEFYTSVGEVYSPYFNDTVAFNSKGLRHLKFKRDSIIRSRADQYIRLKYIRYAKEILEKSTTLQEYRQKEVKENIFRKATYYGFIAIIKDELGMKRLKVIVRQIEGGKMHFWSIIPFWSHNKQLKLHSGDPEED